MTLDLTCKVNTLNDGDYDCGCPAEHDDSVGQESTFDSVIPVTSMISLYVGPIK